MSNGSDLREQILTRATEAGGVIRYRNALNPILWLCLITVGPCLAVMGWAREPPTLVYVLPALVVGVAVFGYSFLLFFDRDRLQSEEYQITKRTLDMIEQKGVRQPIPITTVQVIEPPAPGAP